MTIKMLAYFTGACSFRPSKMIQMHGVPTPARTQADFARIYRSLTGINL